MIRKLSKLIFLFKEKNLIKVMYHLVTSEYLFQIGWTASFKNKMPIDKEAKPLPWVTYPFIDFIENRLDKNFEIFEFGSGNSTQYYSSKIKKIIAVEHDKEWAIKIKANLPNNTELIEQELVYGGNYAKTCFNTNKKFEMIIVDGRDRVNCAIFSYNALKDNGVLILDDSEREEYAEALNFYKKNGFKRIDFWGIAPGLTYKKCTSILYRTNNCLSI